VGEFETPHGHGAAIRTTPLWRNVWKAVTPEDVAVALGLLVLLALGPAAYIASEPSTDTSVGATVDSIADSDVPDVEVQSLPMWVPTDLHSADLGTIRPWVDAALGRQQGAALLGILDPAHKSVVWSAPSNEDGTIFPYSYPALSRIMLSSSVERLADHGSELGAALILLSARVDAEGDIAYPNAAPAAFTLLHLLAAAGDCGDRLNLLLILAAESLPRDDDVVAAAHQASDSCPGDPTPMWLLGQFQSLRASQVGILDLPVKPPPDAAARATRTFDGLVEAFPGSWQALAGAADAHAREGTRLLASQPFTARYELEKAEALYRRAMARSTSIELAAGLARTLLGLGRGDEAVDLLPGAELGPTPGYLLELRTSAAEASADWATAMSSAKELVARGPDAYPAGHSLFATPSLGTSFEGDQINIPMMSVGTASYTPFEVTLAPYEGGGGAVVDDVSYIPRFREDPGYTGMLGACPDWAWRRDAVLAGRAGEALEDLPRGLAFTSDRPVNPFGCSVTFSLDGRTPDLLRAEAGMPHDLSQQASQEVADHRQNLWRWAGDLPRAIAVTEGWLKRADQPALPMSRLAELHFLQGEYDEAAALFGASGRATLRETWNEDLVRDQAILARGASLIAAHREDEGIRLLEGLASDTERGAAYQEQEGLGYAEAFAAVAFHARALLGDTKRASGSVEAALEDYAAAVEQLPILDDPYTGATGYHPERVYGNLSLAQLAAGRESAAESSVGAALEVDPMNPAFLMNAGFVAERSDDIVAAMDFNRRALESDPGAFPAANDLGVQLARQGRKDEAVHELRSAVVANPDYALGWFNLGVVQASMGPRHFLESQGALARAISLDPDLADRVRELTIDAEIYRTGVDLSKPLPPRWSLATTQVYAPVATTSLVAALLMALVLARSSTQSVNDVSDRWSVIAEAAARRVPRLEKLRAPVWAVLITVAIFVALEVFRGTATGWSVTFYGLAVIVLAVSVMRVRLLVARVDGGTPEQSSWPPGMLLGVGLAAAGVPWAPLPVLTQAHRMRVHVAAPVLLMGMTVAFLAEAVWLEVPLTRSLATVTLVMAASTLVPVPPLDGGRMDKRGLVVSIGVVCGSTFALFGLL
jgi:cellulose synthase operon protein C